MSIFLITAPSGAGKTTIMNNVVDTFKYSGFPRTVISECISTTTRPMRENEKNGETYYFISREEFEELSSAGQLAEKVEYSGNLYGIEKSEINRVLKESKHVYIIVEYNGYLQIKEQYPDAVGIFLYMPKVDCFSNMILRGDTYEQATNRISTYEEEMSHRNEYDYVIRNVRDKQGEIINIIKMIISQFD